MGRESRNWLVNRIADTELKRVARTYARGRLIDIGCGEKPYARLFRGHVTEHVGLDHAETDHDLRHADLVGTAYEIPVGDSTFDTALCTAVIEHLEEPEAALHECSRVLKRGGVAIYTAPLFWHLHEEPRDFYRFTKHGLRYLFEKAGFEVVEIKPLSGFWVTGGQMLAYYIDRGNRGVLRRTRVIDAMTSLIQLAAAALERLDRPERWTWMYLVVARKP